MKTLNRILSIVVCCALMGTSLTTLVSCTDKTIDSQVGGGDDNGGDNGGDNNGGGDDVKPEVVFNVSSAADYIGSAEGSSTTFTVTSSTAWSIAEDDNFSFDPASGEGAEEAVTVTASAKATNETFEEKESTAVVTNEEGTEKTVLLIQNTDTTLEFGEMELLEVISGGEIVEIPVVSTLSDWSATCSLESAAIEYDYDNSIIKLTVPVNFGFDVRKINLSLLKGELEGTNTLELVQASDIYFWQGFETVDHTINADGSLTANQNANVADVRIATKSSLGYGTYTLAVEALNIVDKGSNMVLQGYADGVATAYTITLTGASTQGAMIYKPVGAWNGFYTPAGSYDINRATEFKIELLPTAEGGSEMILYMNGTQLITSVGIKDGFAQAIPIVMGLNLKSAGAAEFNSITYKSFTFEPYSAE